MSSLKASTFTLWISVTLLSYSAEGRSLLTLICEVRASTLITFPGTGLGAGCRAIGSFVDFSIMGMVLKCAILMWCRGVSVSFTYIAMPLATSHIWGFHLGPRCVGVRCDGGSTNTVLEVAGFPGVGMR